MRFIKLLNDFDVINSVKNVNQPFTMFKLIRNNKDRWAKINIPIYTAVDFAIKREIPGTLELLVMQLGFVALFETLTYHMMGVDPYFNKSDRDLKMLVSKLNAINVETDYELLKRTTLDEKKYNIRINEKKLPELVESKYILVPSYNYNGEEKETSMIQEHVVGTHEYVLSVGSKQKVLKPAFASNV